MSKEWQAFNNDMHAIDTYLDMKLQERLNYFEEFADEYLTLEQTQALADEYDGDLACSVNPEHIMWYSKASAILHRLIEKEQAGADNG